MILKKSYIALIFLCAVLFKALLEVSYFTFLNPLYEYYGYLLDVNVFKFIESWLFMLFILFFFLKESNKPSGIITFFLFFIIIIPFTSIYWLKDEGRIYFYTILFSFLVTLVIVKTSPIIKFNLLKMPSKYIKWILLVSSLCITGIIFLLNGIPSLAALNLNNVYIVRDSFKYGHKIMEYLVTWEANVINVFLLLVALIRKDRLLLSITVFIQLILYLYTGHKSFLFLLFAMVTIYYLIRYKLMYKVALIIFPISIIIGVLAYRFYDFIWGASLLLNRVFFLPAQISYQYYEFFSNNQLMLLRHSIFERFASSAVYPEHPIKMIGFEYYNGNWPNTGYLGDAYMNFGIIGVVLFSVLLGIILSALDSLSKGGKEIYYITMTFSMLFVVSFSNTALFTALLTGGLGLFLLITIFYKDDKVKV